MARPIRYLTLGLCLVILCMQCGCGSGSGPTPILSNPVSVSLTEHSLTLSGGETHQFSATVTGSSNTNVIWSISGCNGDTCGSISTSGLYSAPSVVSAKLAVNVAAAAAADSSRVDYAALALMPITVTISPMEPWIVPGTTQVFTASVQYDHLNAGVTWALDPACSDNCGTLSNVASTSVTYSAPATASDSARLKLTGSSVSDPSRKAETNITVAAAGGMAEGDYAFVFNGWNTPIKNGYYWMYEEIAAGRFHADAQGNITQGVEDINSQSGVVTALPFTGNYSVGANGRGSFTFITAQGIATFHMVLDASKSKGKFVRYDATQSDSPIFGSGYFELQDKAAFSLAALAGPYAFGVVGTHGVARWAAVGRFDADASGGFTGGSADAAKQTGVCDAPGQLVAANLQLTGSFGTPSASTGRGTAMLNWGSSYKFAYYVISHQKIVLVQVDTRDSDIPVLSGEVRRQNGPFSAASFSAPAVFSKTGSCLSICGLLVYSAVGQLVPDASGSVTGIYDDNHATADLPFTGSYTVAPSGRSEVQMKTVSGDTFNHVAYFFNPNEAFLLQTSGTDVLFGRLKGQAAGPFSEASLSGTYLTYTGPPPGENAENDSGLTTFDGAGGLTATVDVVTFGNLQYLDFNGTYTVAPNGRGTLIFSSPATGSGVFWVVSPGEVVSNGSIAGPRSALLVYEK